MSNLPFDPASGGAHEALYKMYLYLNIWEVLYTKYFIIKSAL